jgi:hypothetical protein
MRGGPPGSSLELPARVGQLRLQRRRWNHGQRFMEKLVATNSDRPKEQAIGESPPANR